MPTMEQSNMDLYTAITTIMTVFGLLFWAAFFCSLPTDKYSEELPVSHYEQTQKIADIKPR